MLARGAHRSRRRRRVLVAALVVAAIVLVVVAAASWLSSSLLIDPHHHLARENVDVKGVAADRGGLAGSQGTPRAGHLGTGWEARAPLCRRVGGPDTRPRPPPIDRCTRRAGARGEGRNR